MRPVLSTMLVVLALLIASPASAQQKMWKEIGAWQIHAFPSGVCVALTATQNSLLSLRLHTESNAVSMIIANTSWRWIEPDRRYPVSLQIASTVAELSAIGSTGGALPSLIIAGQSRAVLDQLGRAPDLRLIHRGETIAVISLADAATAIAAMLDCQRQNGQSQPPASPPAARQAPTQPRLPVEGKPQ